MYIISHPPKARAAYVFAPYFFLFFIGWLVYAAKVTDTRVTTLPGKSWKVMEFSKTIFQAWKVMEISQGHGKSWKVMENTDDIQEFFYKNALHIYIHLCLYLMTIVTTSNWKIFHFGKHS